MSVGTSAQMSSDMKLSLHDKIWNFDVTDPRMHPKGFTIYKVTCRFFAIDRPESLTVIVTWKRYNDFKNLYKSMLNLHKALHRRDSFPVFAKPKVFGRFDEAVIEERRQSALALLNFIGTQPHLYKSQIMTRFLADGQVASPKPKLLSPDPVGGDSRKGANIDILTGWPPSDDKHPPPSLVPTPAEPSGQGQAEGGDRGEGGLDAGSRSDGESSLQQSLDTSGPKALEGTWKFPQVPDSISLDSSTGEDDTDTGDMDSILSSSLPDTDLAAFDPLHTDGKPTPPNSDLMDEAGMTRSNSWLMEAISTCAQMGDGENQEQDAHSPASGGHFRRLSGGDGFEGEPSKGGFESSQSGASSLQNSVEVKLTASGSVVEVGVGDENFVPAGLQGLTESMERKVSCGRGDVDLSSVSSPRSQSISSASSALSTPSHIAGRPSTVRDPGSARNTPPLSPTVAVPRPSSSLSPARAPSPRSPSLSPGKTRMRSPTITSVSNMDLGGKEDYIYLAASQICLAQNSEASGQYQLAFNYYKTGVGILLQGVQGDTNRARRDAVRRKTAQYLMKAEDLYNHHLAAENLDERRWAADSYVSPSLELDPSFAFIRGSVRDLRNYQVLGAIDKVILVLDKSTEETFVIKTIPKMALGSITAENSQRSILPTTCPYMVNLHKFFETDYAIYLLLQYASGGRLWTYITSYLHQSSTSVTAAGDSNNFVGGGGSRGNVYMGQKMHEDANAVMGGKTGGGVSAAGGEGRGSEKEKKGSGAKPQVLPSGIRFSDLQAKLVSPDSDTVVAGVSDKGHVSKKSAEQDLSSLQFPSETAEKKDPVERNGKINGAVSKASASEERDSIAEGTDTADANTSQNATDNRRILQTQDSLLEDSSFNPRRLSSLSSDEYHRSVSQEDGDRFPDVGKTDEAADHFHELLRQNQDNLENFSINSYDSDNIRLSSTFSASEAPVDMDMPGFFSSPASGGLPLSTIPDEVFSADGLAQTGDDDLIQSYDDLKQPSNDNLVKPVSAGQGDVNDMLQNSRALLRTVERTLSQVDGDENTVTDSDMCTDTSGGASLSFSGIEDASEKECCTTCTESVGSEEISIYDTHRHSDDSDSTGENSRNSVNSTDVKAGPELTVIVESEKMGAMKAETSEEMGAAMVGISDTKVDVSNTNSEHMISGAPACNETDERTALSQPSILKLPGSDITKDSELDSESSSTNTIRRRTASSTSTHSLTTSGSTSRKVSYCRSVSGEMVRSASFECDLKSPTRNRARTISDLFEQLDHETPENVVLPEAVVRRWAAELVIALSRLHAAGIICRDLKPDNVLLGEGGHIFLTYFCQVGQAEKELDWNAVEQMYVAPEVRSISGSDTSCDWWSLGALLYELLVGRSLYVCHPGGILPYTNIFIPSHVSDEGRSLLQELLRYNPRERLGSGIAGAEEIKAHNFFANIDWHHLEYV